MLVAKCHVSPANLNSAVGSCPCVGVLGAGLGGGHGRLQGLHGMSIDSMRRMRVVLASGKAINVSPTENADLWYGIRGAGQNFGVVIEADFQTAPQVPKGSHYDVEMQFADSELEKVLELMNQQIKAPLPPQLAVDIVFGANTTTLKVNKYTSPAKPQNTNTFSPSPLSPSTSSTQAPSPKARNGPPPGKHSALSPSSKQTSTGPSCPSKLPTVSSRLNASNTASKTLTQSI